MLGCDQRTRFPLPAYLALLCALWPLSLATPHAVAQTSVVDGAQAGILAGNGFLEVFDPRIKDLGEDALDEALETLGFDPIEIFEKRATFLSEELNNEVLQFAVFVEVFGGGAEAVAGDLLTNIVTDPYVAYQTTITNLTADPLPISLLFNSPIIPLSGDLVARNYLRVSGNS